MTKRIVSWILILMLILSTSGFSAAFAEGEADTFTVTIGGEAQRITVDDFNSSGFYVGIDDMEAVEAAAIEGSNVTVEGLPSAENVEVIAGNITDEVISEHIEENDSVEANSLCISINTDKGTNTISADNVTASAIATAPTPEEDIISYVSASAHAVDAVASGEAVNTIKTGDVTASATATSSVVDATALSASAQQGGTLTIESGKASATAEALTITDSFYGNATAISALSNGSEVTVMASSAEATGTNTSATGIIASSIPLYSFNDEDTSAPQDITGGKATVTIDQDVVASGAYGATGISATSFGEGSSTTIDIGESVETVSVDGQAAGVLSVSYCTTYYSPPYFSAAGTTEVSIAKDVTAESMNAEATAIITVTLGEGNNTVSVGGNVEVSGNHTATGITASSNANSYHQYDPNMQKMRAYYSNGGTTTVAVGGDIDVTSHHNAEGIEASATGDTSSTIVNTGNVTVTVKKLEGDPATG